MNDATTDIIDFIGRAKKAAGEKAYVRAYSTGRVELRASRPFGHIVQAWQLSDADFDRLYNADLVDGWC